MGAWDIYQNRIMAHGSTKHDATYIREARFVESRLPDNLSYHQALVYPSEYCYNIKEEPNASQSFYQDVAIINSDNLNEKTMISMPGDDIFLGSLIYWMNDYWLVAERDSNATVYVKTKLLQCNHILKWLTEDNKIIEQWCVVEDGTKYLTGEVED